MHEMQAVVTDVCSVCLSVCHGSTTIYLGFTVWGSFGTAFAKLLCLLLLLKAFYPVSDHLVIRHGDYLVSRCTYDATNRSRDTHIGATHNDEMCNLYVMFYTRNGHKSYFTCLSNSFPELFHDIPVDNDVPLPPNPWLDAVAAGRMHKGTDILPLTLMVWRYCLWDKELAIWPKGWEVIRHST